MKNIYHLQYQILILSLSIFYIAYCLIEYPYVIDIYSITFGQNSTISFEHRLLYNLYYSISKQPLLIQSLFLLKIPIAIGFLFNPTRKLCFILILIHSSLFHQIRGYASPEEGFLNFLLLLLIAVPNRSFNFFKSFKYSYWSYPRRYQFLAWIVAGLAYSTSGYFKLLTPKWYSGIYLISLIKNSFMIRYDLNTLLNYNFFYNLLFFLNYYVVAIELLALPMVFNKYTRLLSFVLLSTMHIFIFIFIDVGQISMGTLVFHVFLFDPRWLRIKFRSRPIDTTDKFMA